MFRFYLSVSVVILFFCPRTAAQDYRIQKLGVENGLSSNYIVSITQDKEDFLWFATEHGLNRFDGIRTISYKKAAGDNSISAMNSIKYMQIPKKMSSGSQPSVKDLTNWIIIQGKLQHINLRKTARPP